MDLCCITQLPLVDALVSLRLSEPSESPCQCRRSEIVGNFVQYAGVCKIDTIIKGQRVVLCNYVTVVIPCRLLSEILRGPLHKLCTGLRIFFPAQDQVVLQYDRWENHSVNVQRKG